MPKYIKKKDLKNAIDECTWYHIGKGGELVEGANSSEHEPLYKYSDIKEIIKNLPTRKFETEPKRTALSKALKWTYGDEPNCSEKPNNCETCRYESLASYEGACDDCTDMDGRPTNYEPKTEPLDKDTNVRSKDEPNCEECKHFNEQALTYMKQCKYYFMECRFEPKGEPQKDCKKCKNYDRCKNNRWKCCVYQPKDEPQTVRSNLEPFRVDEPQTEREGMTYIKWLEDNCLHILDVSWICDEMHEYPEEWEYCSRNCNDGSAECLKRLYRASNSSEKPNNCKTEPQTDGYMNAEQTEAYREMLNKAQKKCYGNIFEDEPQTNADKFKRVFGLYATEVWSMYEADFLEWLNEKHMERSK